MANCLVTGGAGFIGSHIVDGLLAEGHAVRVFDNFLTGKPENLAHLQDRIEIFEGDACHDEEILRASLGIDFIFHQAALPSVPVSLEYPEESNEINIGGTLNVLRAAVTQKCKRVIYAASSSAYGDQEASPKREDMVPAPLSPYAVQKLAGEHYCKAFHACFGLETLAIRYFNVFGPRQDPASQYAAAIPAFVTSILHGQQPTVYGDGEQTRDWTFIENVVHGNLLALNAKKTAGQAVNVACGENISINAVIAAINEALGTSMSAVYEERRAGDVMHSTADINLARDLLGYVPKVSFKEGLSRAIEYYRELATAK